MLHGLWVVFLLRPPESAAAAAAAAAAVVPACWLLIPCCCAGRVVDPVLLRRPCLSRAAARAGLSQCCWAGRAEPVLLRRLDTAQVTAGSVENAELAADYILLVAEDPPSGKIFRCVRRACLSTNIRRGLWLQRRRAWPCRVLQVSRCSSVLCCVHDMRMQAAHA
eukprot:354939-Chlamydomonas_euryale.AAC.1